MDSVSRIDHYEESACREELAAARATCVESALAHTALARIYRREIAHVQVLRNVPRMIVTA